MKKTAICNGAKLQAALLHFTEQIYSWNFIVSWKDLHWYPLSRTGSGNL